MNRLAKNLLKITFLIDSLLAIGFGIYSWLWPYETHGTIFAIPEMHSSVFLSILSSLSLFYILIGFTCLIGVKSSYPINIWIGLLMLVRHFLEGILKFGDFGKDWLIGNPYPDLIIHTFFIIVYGLAIYFSFSVNRLAFAKKET